MYYSLSVWDKRKGKQNRMKAANEREVRERWRGKPSLAKESFTFTSLEQSPGGEMYNTRNGLSSSGVVGRNGPIPVNTFESIRRLHPLLSSTSAEMDAVNVLCEISMAL